VSASCVVPVYSWSVLILFRRMSTWLLALRSWDLIGISAYAQTFAFLESAVLLLALVLLSALLPARFFRHKFVAQGSIIALLASVYAVVLQYKPGIVSSPGALFFGVALYFVSNGVACILIHRYRRLEEIICALVERLMALLYIYIAVTFLSVIVVVFRNI
jgi:hypothetical protein